MHSRFLVKFCSDFSILLALGGLESQFLPFLFDPVPLTVQHSSLVSCLRLSQLFLDIVLVCGPRPQIDLPGILDLIVEFAIAQRLVFGYPELTRRLIPREWQLVRDREVRHQFVRDRVLSTRLAIVAVTREAVLQELSTDHVLLAD